LYRRNTQGGDDHDASQTLAHQNHPEDRLLEYAAIEIRQKLANATAAIIQPRIADWWVCIVGYELRIETEERKQG